MGQVDLLSSVVEWQRPASFWGEGRQATAMEALHICDCVNIGSRSSTNSLTTNVGAGSKSQLFVGDSAISLLTTCSVTGWKRIRDLFVQVKSGGGALGGDRSDCVDFILQNCRNSSAMKEQRSTHECDAACQRRTDWSRRRATDTADGCHYTPDDCCDGDWSTSRTADHVTADSLATSVTSLKCCLMASDLDWVMAKPSRAVFRAAQNADLSIGYIVSYSGSRDCSTNSTHTVAVMRRTRRPTDFGRLRPA